MREVIKRYFLFAALVLTGCAAATAAPPSTTDAGFWRVMDTRAMGSEKFIKKHPDWDGRNAIIAVLDTGVDMSIAGLQKTSTGLTKVIEARDFTGQGDVTLFEATSETIDGVLWLKSDEGKVRGYDKLTPQPVDGKWRFGFLLESRFKNSAVSDINLNGSTNDKFALLVAKTKKGFVAFVDLAAKGDFTGAKAIRNYGKEQQFFTMTLEDPKTMTPPLTFALHINDDATQIVLHFDDGGHGTHVAGIASGFGLMGRKGFNGIAPGAQVLSLKIGDNTLSGGSTTSDSMRKAIEFAGEWSKKHKRAVIINMSYGIGSEIEGESDIDLALDDLLQKYPMLSACVSAGNSGPGLSTVGTPAAARLAVTAAAMLPKAASEAMFGSPTDRDKVFSFSSRGGELSKPDLLAPGIASASVPRFDHRDIKGGTSMAAPQLAGAHALLVSAALATKTRFTGRTLKRALIDSASPISGYLPIAQGAGVPNISSAFKALKALSTHKEPFAVAGYAVRAAVPTSDSGFGHAAYWRVGNWLPAPEDGQSFSISALFHDVSAKEREGFQTMLRFKSDSAWLKVDRRFGRLLGENKLKIRVKYNRKALVKPGVYHGGIQVYPDDGAGIAAARLWNTIVVPYTFNEGNHYRLTRKNMRLDPGDFERIPILVPPGATHCRIALSVPRGKWGSNFLKIYDPRGRKWSPDQHRANSKSGSTAYANISGDDLMPGVWEVMPYASFRNTSPSHYNISVQFRGIDSQPISRFKHPAGKTPTGSFSVTNRFNNEFVGDVSGEIVGYRRSKTVTVEDDDFERNYTMNSEIQQIDLVLKISAKTYNRFTDIPINVLDSDGNAVRKNGFMNGVARISVPNSGRMTLQIKGGFTRSGGDPWKIQITETWIRHKTIKVSVDDDLTLYPNIAKKLSFKLSATPPLAPSGYTNAGELRFTDKRNKEIWLTVPIELVPVH